MKTFFSLSLGLLALVPMQAQIFGPQTLNGALLGGIAGAVIGHNSGSLSHNGWQGAAIGAGVGAVLGAAADNRAARYETGVPVPSPKVKVVPREVVIRKVPRRTKVLSRN